jgi:hypothetical protein
MVYLLHFDRPLAHAQHYLGSTELTVEERVDRHLSGDGSPLVRAVVAAGIGVKVARTWKGGRRLEKKFKRAQHNRALCPICTPSLKVKK